MSKMMKVSPGVDLQNMDDLSRFARAAFDSGLFKSGKDVASAIVVMQLGMELGLGPVTALQGIYTVQGRPAMSAQLMSSLVKRAGYRFKVNILTDEEVAIEFFEELKGEWVSLGISSFSKADAKKAKLTGGNYDKFPRNMLWARAMANGARWFCGDALGGAPHYTPDELGAEVDEEGEPVSVTLSPAEEEAVGAVVEAVRPVEEPEEAEAYIQFGDLQVPCEEWEKALPYILALRACEDDNDIQAALTQHGPVLKKLGDQTKKLVTWEYRMMVAAVSGEQASVDRIMHDAKQVFDAVDDIIRTELRAQLNPNAGNPDPEGDDD